MQCGINPACSNWRLQLKMCIPLLGTLNMVVTLENDLAPVDCAPVLAGPTVVAW